MNRAISGSLAVLESGRPLSGIQVVAVQETPQGIEVLGATVSGDFGRFRITYPPLSRPADLLLYLFAPTGQIIFAEPVHRQVSGAELCLTVAVPRIVLALLME